MSDIIVSLSAQKHIQKFISYLKSEEDLSHKTLVEYKSDLKNFAYWFEQTWQSHNEIEQHFAPSEIVTPTIVHYREYMQIVRKLKPATINRRLITLKRYLEWAYLQGLIETNPAKPIKLVPEEKTSPRQMTDQEEASLVTATEKDGNLRDQTIVLLMLHTGLREMEVCDAMKTDIILGKRSGRIIVRSGKGNKQREVPLNITIRSKLEEYLATLNKECVYLFPSGKMKGRLSERGLRYIIGKYVKLAGLEGISAHDLRHRFGYVMARKTPLHRLAQIMGHDSLDTTTIYVKATKDDLQAEVEKIAWQ